MKNILQIIVFSFFVQLILFPQHRVILKPDEAINQKMNSFLKEGNKHHLKNDDSGKKISEKFSGSLNGMIDTLSYNDGTFNTNFPIGGQEWLLQWYKAPADLIFRKMGFFCTSNPDDITAEAKIVRVLLPEDSLITPSIKWWGYYEALGNGYNDITAFFDNPDRTGPWIPSQLGFSEPFGEDIFGDGGVGAPFVPDETLQDYQWIESSLLIDIEISAGEIFGVAVKNTSPNMGGNTISFLSGTTDAYGWKIYINGRLDPGVDKGWWTREFTFDFPVVVDFITNVEQIGNNIPEVFSLSQNYPNPFNPSTVISYQLPVSNYVTLKVYDVLGNEVATLVNEHRSAGTYTAEFNGINLSSGAYIYKIQAGDPSTGSGQSFVKFRKMILLK